MEAKDYDPAFFDNLTKLIAQLVPNPGNRIPTEPGFCFDLAYFRDPLTADQGEQITMAAKLPSRPDIALILDSKAGIKPDTAGLLKRNEAAHARAPAIVNLAFTNVRAAPRTIGGLTGDELVERVMEPNFAQIYGFNWEVNGTEGNVLVPHLTLTMATGRSREGPIPSSLSLPAALSLWDKIASSIRIRPTQPLKASEAERPSTPLGTLAQAGDTCPLSGWWQCSDGGGGIGVLGGQRRHIRQGQRMPQALLLPPQTWWEKLRGLQPSFEAMTPTTWKLIDKRSRKQVAPGVPLAQVMVAAPTAAGAGASVQQVPQGTCAATGSPCPASGRWRCEEAHSLDGTRWFSQGSLLPAATFAVETTTRSKFIQRRAIWRLMRLAQSHEPTV